MQHISLKVLMIGCFCFIMNNEMLAQHARIKIDVARTIGEVDSHIYGNFVEHLGRCVYGGIYDTVSSLSDKNGFRKDVMAAGGPFQIYEVNGPDLKSSNDFDKEYVKTLPKTPVSASGTKFTYTFPPHSFTLMKGRL